MMVWCLAMFFKDVGILEANEVVVLANLEALRLFGSHNNGKVIMESDLRNAVS